MTGDGNFDEGELRHAIGLLARMRRKEAEFQKYRRMCDYHEAQEMRQGLRRLGFDIAPGKGWDGPPVAG